MVCGFWQLTMSDLFYFAKQEYPDSRAGKEILDLLLRVMLKVPAIISLLPFVH